LSSSDISSDSLESDVGDDHPHLHDDSEAIVILQERGDGFISQYSQSQQPLHGHGFDVNPLLLMQGHMERGPASGGSLYS